MRKIYKVTEIITDTKEENSWGYYSSLKRAQKAILKRVAEAYTPQEMANFHFSNDGYYYQVPDNEWASGCEYTIEDWDVNAELE